REAGDRPVVSLGPARNGNAGRAVEPQDVEHVVGVRALEQLLEPRGIFEAVLEMLGALRGVLQKSLARPERSRGAVEPGLLLLGIEELAQALGSGPVDHRTALAKETAKSPKSHRPTRAPTCAREDRVAAPPVHPSWRIGVARRVVGGCGSCVVLFLNHIGT